MSGGDVSRETKPKPRGARVMHEAGSRYLGWCDEHQDGFRAGRVPAEEWARKHNADQHKESNE